MNKKWFILLSLILVIVGAVLLMHSSYFGVKTILVIGNHQMTSEQIINASGIVKGQNMFLLPGREAANRLLNYVRIKGVKLERRFPSVLAIIIKERSGLGFFQTKEGKWLEVSEDGVILATFAPSEKKPQLPFVKGLQPKLLDKQVEMTDEVSNVLVLMKALLPWQKQITEVHYRPNDLQVLFTSGLIVLFGHASDLTNNILVFEKILANLKKTGKIQNVKYIDLRYSGKPVIRGK